VDDLFDKKPVGKVYGHADVFCTEFIIECLAGDAGQAADFDAMVYSPKIQTYCGIEIHRVMPTNPVMPWDHDPNRFWQKCRFKYYRLWHIMRSMQPAGVFFDVFVGDNDSHLKDQVKVFKIRQVYSDGVEFWREWRWSRKEFSDWYRLINKNATLYTPKPKPLVT